ncbi:MAG TPA: hypothetical protein VH436_25605 [Vicinamibacterales bacterium]|jgi:hypothetical protein
MRRQIVLFVFLAACVIGVPAVAQEGHPLKGSWIGTWGPSKVHSNDLLVILNWDGKAISGTINPGTDDIAIKNATLNPEGWVVHFEADAKDKAGPINYVFDGKIEGLAFHNRTISGTWKSNRENGQFKLQRQ